MVRNTLGSPAPGGNVNLGGFSASATNRSRTEAVIKTVAWRVSSRASTTPEDNGLGKRADMKFHVGHKQPGCALGSHSFSDRTKGGQDLRGKPFEGVEKRFLG